MIMRGIKHSDMHKLQDKIGIYFVTKTSDAYVQEFEL